jgi:hypothetical protein
MYTSYFHLSIVAANISQFYSFHARTPARTHARTHAPWTCSLLALALHIRRYQVCLMAPQTSFVHLKLKEASVSLKRALHLDPKRRVERRIELHKVEFVGRTSLIMDRAVEVNYYCPHG